MSHEAGVWQEDAAVVLARISLQRMREPWRSDGGSVVLSDAQFRHLRSLQSRSSCVRVALCWWLEEPRGVLDLWLELGVWEEDPAGIFGGLSLRCLSQSRRLQN